MLFSVASLSSTPKMYSFTSLRARFRISWLRSSLRGRPGKLITQSGCARYRSLSGFTISGSTHRPKSMPKLVDVIDQRL